MQGFLKVVIALPSKDIIYEIGSFLSFTYILSINNKQKYKKIYSVSLLLSSFYHYYFF